MLRHRARLLDLPGIQSCTRGLTYQHHSCHTPGPNLPFQTPPLFPPAHPHTLASTLSTHLRRRGAGRGILGLPGILGLSCSLFAGAPVPGVQAGGDFAGHEPRSPLLFGVEDVHGLGGMLIAPLPLHAACPISCKVRQAGTQEGFITRSSLAESSAPTQGQLSAVFSCLYVVACEYLAACNRVGCHTSCCIV